MCRIAVIDSDPELLGFLREALSIRGWEIETFTDAASALPLVRRGLPDVVILDIWLETPTSGWELFCRLNDDVTTRAIPVIICSDQIRFLSENKSRVEKQAHALLPKPFELDDLYRSVEVALA